MNALRNLIIICLANYTLIAFPQSVTNMVSSDSVRDQIRNEAETKFKVVKWKKDLYLKVVSTSSTRTPSTYFATCHVNPGEVYTYALSGKACSKNKVALYITSPQGNIGWPGTMIEDGIAEQKFKVPDNVHEVSLAISFLYPKEGECAYIYDIGLFKDSDDVSDWKSSNNEGLRPYINKEKGIENDITEESSDLKTHAKKAVRLPPNLFALNGLSEIKREDLVEMSLAKQDGEGFLKVLCSQTTLTPSIYFKTLKVNAGKTYSYFIYALPSPDVKVYFYVNSPNGHIVWPGLKLVDGINKQLFIVPEGTTEITLGISFINPVPEEFVLVKDIALYEGDIDTFQWDASENEGLRPLLEITNTHWLWLIFPVALVILYILYIRHKKISLS